MSGVVADATPAVDRVRVVSPMVWVGALLMPVGPAAVAVLRLILPYYTAPDPTATVVAVEGELGRQSAVVWLGYVAVLTLVPGLYAAAQVCRSAAPRLTAWAMGLAVPGYLSLGMLAGQDQVLWSVASSGLSVSQGVAITSEVHPAVNLSIGVFVLGHVVGTVLLGLALLRSRHVPAWAAWAIAVSQPLHFIATVILGSPQVDFVAWSLTAVGMAMVARVVIRDR